MIDDDARVLQTLCDILKSLGHEAMEAKSASAGLACVDAAAPDMVIVNRVMPGVSGVDVIARLGRTHPSLPVLMLTAASDPDVEADVRRHGGFGVLQKPISIADLKRHIERALNQHGT